MREVPAAIAEKIPLAASIFAEHGFDDARIDDIATAVGVPRATLYYYFAGKEDILAFLLRSLLDEIARHVHMATESGGSGLARLRAVLRAQLEVLAANPSTAQLLIGDIGRAGRLADIAAAVDAAFHRPVQRVLLDGIDDGTLREIDVERAAAAIFGTVMMTGLHELVMHDQLPVDELLTVLERVLLDGMIASTDRH